MTDNRFVAGTKYDAGKPPMHLIPWEAMAGVAQVLDFGRVKYGSNQWRSGFEWGRLVGACLRHIFAWLSGEDKDPESGLSHIDHALCCLMFLTAHIKGGLGKDDRYTQEQAQAPVIKPVGYQWFLRLFDSNLPNRKEPRSVKYATREDAEAEEWEFTEQPYLYILAEVEL